MTDITDRIAKLLAKAESTQYPAEAEALTQKAMALMAKHAISEGMVKARAEVETGIKEEVETRRYDVPSPYSEERFLLFNSIARVMGARAFYYRQRRDGTKTALNIRQHHTMAAIVGYAADIDRIIELFESLIKQEEAARKFEVEARYFESMGEKKVFSKNFIKGFTWQVYDRLQELYREEVESTGAALVLVDRQSRVEQAYNELNLQAAPTSNKQVDYSGARAGRAAGQRANLNRSLGD